MKITFLNWYKTHWSMKLGVISLTLALLAVGVYWLINGDGHFPPEYEPSLVERVELCPSVQKSESEIISAAERIVENTNCVVPDIDMATCIGRPERGVMQIRACTDLIPTTMSDGTTFYNAGCPEGYFDTVQFHPYLPGTGVTYWQSYRDLPRTPDHLLLHIIGVGLPKDGADGHTTAATSVMNKVAGSSFDLVSCGGDLDQ